MGQLWSFTPRGVSHSRGIAGVIAKMLFKYVHPYNEYIRVDYLFQVSSKTALVTASRDFDFFINKRGEMSSARSFAITPDGALILIGGDSGEVSGAPERESWFAHHQP